MISNIPLELLMKAVLETVQECGPMGSPGGVIYAALMTQGITFDQYEIIMGVLVETKKVTKRGDCYFPVEA